MKKIIQLAVLISFAMSSVFVAPQAEAGSRKGYRYKARYDHFDRGFSRHYGYREERCEINSPWQNTCYVTQASTVVYVEERIDGDFGRVTVYIDSGYTRPYATYHTHRRHVGYRTYDPSYRYYSYNNYYSHPYYTPYYTTVVWNPIDWDNGWDRIFVGVNLVAIGIDVAANTHGDAGNIAGGVAIGLGVLAIISGAQKNAKKSELAKTIEQEARR